MTRPDHLEHAADAHREAIGLIAQLTDSTLQDPLAVAARRSKIGPDDPIYECEHTT